MIYWNQVTSAQVPREESINITYVNDPFFPSFVNVISNSSSSIASTASKNNKLSYDGKKKYKNLCATMLFLSIWLSWEEETSNHMNLLNKAEKIYISTLSNDDDTLCVRHCVCYDTVYIYFHMSLLIIQIHATFYIFFLLNKKNFRVWEIANWNFASKIKEFIYTRQYFFSSSPCCLAKFFTASGSSHNINTHLYNSLSSSLFCKKFKDMRRKQVDDSFL